MILAANFRRYEKTLPRDEAGQGFILRGAEGTRTPDPLHAMQMRYQLRHSPLLLPRYINTFRWCGVRFPFGQRCRS